MCINSEISYIYIYRMNDNDDYLMFIAFPRAKFLDAQDSWISISCLESDFQ